MPPSVGLKRFFMPVFLIKLILFCRVVGPKNFSMPTSVGLKKFFMPVFLPILSSFPFFCSTLTQAVQHVYTALVRDAQKKGG